MLDIYTLSRNWFNWCFENPEKINPNHSALYFFCIEHCNRLGWKEKFGLPTSMAKEAIGIKSYNTYKKTLDDLVKFGFIEMIEISKNQYSSNIIALSKKTKALDKALDKALIKHTSKQSESTHQSTSSIDIQLYNNTNIQVDDEYFLVNGKIENGNIVDWYFKNHQTLYEALLMQLQASKFDIEIQKKLREHFINGFSFNDYKHIPNAFAKFIRENIKTFIPQKSKMVY